eukprot:6653769-Ditylum_brightwellii.AAC.1
MGDSQSTGKCVDLDGDEYFPDYTLVGTEPGGDNDEQTIDDPVDIFSLVFTAGFKTSTMSEENSDQISVNFEVHNSLEKAP